ncbi:MAG: endo-1,4-beta-xylanase, partial [Sedimentisphaerales bacterium]|nr:endo-1,4-beta-xylanase [Sedimentisphaerales bacterium]
GDYSLLPYRLGLLTLQRPEKPALKDVFKDYFLIGGAYNRNLVTGRDPNAAQIAVRHNNTATSENDMKWQSVHPQPGQYTWGPADSFMEFCETNKMFPLATRSSGTARLRDGCIGTSRETR